MSNTGFFLSDPGNDLTPEWFNPKGRELLDGSLVEELTGSKFRFTLPHRIGRVSSKSSMHSMGEGNFLWCQRTRVSRMIFYRFDGMIIGRGGAAATTTTAIAFSPLSQSQPMLLSMIGRLVGGGELVTITFPTGGYTYHQFGSAARQLKAMKSTYIEDSWASSHHI
jgi:hypothetical protein